MTSSFILEHTAHVTPLRSSISLTISNCRLSLSITRTLCGNICEFFIIGFACSIASSETGNGNETVNVLPCPGSLSTVIFPFSKATRPLVIGSPNPKPSELVPVDSLSNGRNICEITSLLMPMPVSVTLMDNRLFL